MMKLNTEKLKYFDIFLQIIPILKKTTTHFE